MKLQSFGYKGGGAPPEEATAVFDCRTLSNPYYQPELRCKNGLDDDVKLYVLHDPKLVKLMHEVEPHLYEDAVLAFGCFGGKHRSVAVVEILAYIARNKGWDVTTEHLAL